MTRLRRAIHLTLILAVLATAQIVGMARGQASVAGEMVICSGGAVVTVQVDADGNPVGPPHFCPDCAMTLLVAGSMDEPALARPFSLRFVAWDPLVVPPVAPAPLIAPSARDPPASV
ncbi:MAG: hypothetical protein CSA72_01650 [Rhodobacterales bacterium]|nr:MAG: hypothetical protein CSA72_01650 [Rhodobacterales bacterium]